MNQTERGGDAARTLLLLSLLALAIGAWAIRHGYQGIVHDGVFYAFQALAEGDGAYLREDLFLRYGSQDAFTFFPSLLRLFFDAWGLAGGAAVFAVLSSVLWLAALSVLAFTLARDRLIAGAMVLFVAAFAPNYGVRDLLSFGETFPTPRILVEALTLFALAAALRGRTLVAVALLVVGAALHPIMAAAGLGVLVVFLALGDRRWWAVAALGVVAVVAASAAGVAPLDRLGRTIDPEWRSIIEERNSYLFFRYWGLGDWLGAIFDCLALVCAASLVAGAERRLYLACVVGLATGVAATAIGADLIGDVLMLQIQPSRVLWLCRAIAIVAFARVVLKLLAEDGAASPAVRALAVFALAAAALAGASLIAALLAALTMTLLAVIAPAAVRSGSEGGRASRALTALLLGAALALVVFVVGSSLWRTSQVPPAVSEYLRLAPAAAFLPVAAIAFGLGLILVRKRLGAAAGAAALTASVAIAGVGLANWDRRTPWQSEMETAFAGDVGDMIGADEEVLATGEVDLSLTWFGLNRRSYVAIQQGAGLVFSRETAMEFARRREIAAPLSTLLSTDRRRAAPIMARTDYRLSDIEAACAAEAGPDLILSPVLFEEGKPEELPLSAPAPFLYFEPESETKVGLDLNDTLYVYRCG